MTLAGPSREYVMNLLFLNAIPWEVFVPFWLV
jgi:hypothetical protein